ncbi:hypothetical protein ISR5_1556 [Streptococcus pyogenes]|nr:hypothetical protein ISR5_1556 [Streptococcus pyogenes]
MLPSLLLLVAGVDDAVVDAVAALGVFSSLLLEEAVDADVAAVDTTA